MKLETLKYNYKTKPHKFLIVKTRFKGSKEKMYKSKIQFKNRNNMFLVR